MDQHTRAPKKWTLSKTRINGQFVVETETNVPGCQNTIVTCGFKPYAELIAAAPDLLEACKYLLALVDDMSRFVGQMALHDYALFNEAPIRAVEAINKAEGRDRRPAQPAGGEVIKWRR